MLQNAYSNGKEQQMLKNTLGYLAFGLVLSLFTAAGAFSFIMLMRSLQRFPLSHDTMEMATLWLPIISGILVFAIWIIGGISNLRRKKSVGL
jgi:hypothetical protein